MDLIYILDLNCKVCPLARPRKGYYGNMYQPKENQRELFNALDEYVATNGILEPLDQPLCIDICIQFERKPSNKSKVPTSRFYGDLDNLVKAVNDALVAKGIIKDDSIIIRSLSEKRFGDSNNLWINIYGEK